MQNIKILVPLDFSDFSTRALSAAEVFARMFNGKVVPFHSYVPVSEMDGPYMLGLGPTATEDYEEMERVLHERLQEIAGDHVEEQYLGEAIISIGNPAHSIVEAGKDFDMIAMSTHGRTGFTRFFLGSVAEKVLRLSHIPVLILDKESELKEIDNILLTTDFSENSYAAFPYARDIATTSNARLELLNVLHVDETDDGKPDKSKVSLREQRLKIIAKEELHEISDRLDTNVLVSTDTPHEAILNYNMNNRHDLVVMATVGRTGIDYLMMGSTTANVVRHVKSPVLSINPKQKKVLEREESS